MFYRVLSILFAASSLPTLSWGAAINVAHVSCVDTRDACNCILSPIFVGEVIAPNTFTRDPDIYLLKADGQAIGTLTRETLEAKANEYKFIFNKDDSHFNILKYQFDIQEQEVILQVEVNSKQDSSPNSEKFEFRVPKQEIRTGSVLNQELVDGNALNKLYTLDNERAIWSSYNNGVYNFEAGGFNGHYLDLVRIDPETDIATLRIAKRGVAEIFQIPAYEPGIFKLPLNGPIVKEGEALMGAVRLSESSPNLLKVTGRYQNGGWKYDVTPNAGVRILEKSATSLGNGKVLIRARTWQHGVIRFEVPEKFDRYEIEPTRVGGDEKNAQYVVALGLDMGGRQGHERSLLKVKIVTNDDPRYGPSYFFEPFSEDISILSAEWIEDRPGYVGKALEIRGVGTIKVYFPKTH